MGGLSYSGYKCESKWRQQAIARMRELMRRAVNVVPPVFQEEDSFLAGLYVNFGNFCDQGS